MSSVCYEFQKFKTLFITVAADTVDLNPRGIVPYKGYIGMCSSKGQRCSAVLVINRALILAI